MGKRISSQKSILVYAELLTFWCSASDILHHPTTSLIPLQKSQNSEDQRRAHFHDDQGPFFGALWSLQSLQSLRVWRLGNDMKPSPTNIWSGVVSKHCTLHAIYPPVRVEHLAEILGMTRSGYQELVKWCFLNCILRKPCENFPASAQRFARLQVARVAQ